MMQLNISNKTSGCLNRNSVPTELLYGIPGGRFSVLDVQKPKKGKASEHIVPFFLKIFNLKETILTRSIANCVIELDNLAIQIDSLIDPKVAQLTSGLSVDKFDDLETQIVGCFSSLSGASGLEQLIAFTLDYVNTSFNINTSERHLIYNFEKGVSCSKCTTMYLLPLIKYLITVSKTSFEVERIFILTANYIQLLDDFIDVFDDINLNIATPVTERFIKINCELSFVPAFKSSFEALVYDVSHKLDGYLKAIKQEIQEIRGGKNVNEILQEWRKFHFEFSSIPVPANNNNSEQLEYLQKIHGITPPMLCYTG